MTRHFPALLATIIIMAACSGCGHGGILADFTSGENAGGGDSIGGNAGGGSDSAGGNSGGDTGEAAWEEPEGNEVWSISASSPDATMRAVHMTGNWGDNRLYLNEVTDIPQEYFDYLRDLNVNWVGLSVSFSVEDSMDPTVDIVTSSDDPAITLTIPDDVLRSLIRAFRSRGFHFYVSTSFEDMDKGAAGRVFPERWRLGDPYAVADVNDPAKLTAANWPWDPAHPNHDAFVSQFFASLTGVLVHFAKIAEEEGAELFSIGTETDRLFRTRTLGDIWPDEHRAEVQALVDTVRAAYSGKLTYDMAYSSLVSDGFETGRYIWQDIEGFDVVGVSSYFHHSTGPTLEELIPSWEGIFEEYVDVLHAENPGRDIVFTELGYVDHPGARGQAEIDEFQPKDTTDLDSDGKYDGEEEQANLFDAFFSVMNGRRGWMKGAFLWDNWITTQQKWDEWFGTRTTFSIRGKLSHDVVKRWYGTFAEHP